MAAGHSPLGFGSDSVIYPELSDIAPTSPEPGSAHHRAASVPHVLATWGPWEGARGEGQGAGTSLGIREKRQAGQPRAQAGEKECDKTG